MRRRICVVTGSRAEYGLLFCLMREISADPALELQIVATGMHCSPEFGRTVDVIMSDGFTVAAKVETLLSSDTAVGVSKSIGLGLIGFADTFERLQPHLVVVLGDRFEIFAAAQAAMVARIPVAHIHGGEVTEGAIDEAIRHSITKIAQLHFVAAAPYRRRVLQLGESPERVFNFGAPGLDLVQEQLLLDRAQLEEELGFRFGPVNVLLTYHPATLGSGTPEEGFASLLSALDATVPEAHLVITRPNADTGSRRLMEMIDEYITRNPGRTMAAVSLGQRLYLSVMAICDLVIGNSSSGLIEAPALRRATVNIGDRQQGRLRASSVIDCPEDSTAIAAAIRRALSEEFRNALSRTVSPYGSGGASRRIMEVLKSIDLEQLARKQFHDQ